MGNLLLTVLFVGFANAQEISPALKAYCDFVKAVCSEDLAQAANRPMNFPELIGQLSEKMEPAEIRQILLKAVVQSSDKSWQQTKDPTAESLSYHRAEATIARQLAQQRTSIRNPQFLKNMQYVEQFFRDNQKAREASVIFEQPKPAAR